MANETLYKPSEMPSAIHELGEQLNSAKYGFEKIEGAIEYSKGEEPAASNEEIIPSQIADEVQTLAENYRGAVDEIAQDNAYFDDISTAIQTQDGGDPPEKSEMANRIGGLVPPQPTGRIIYSDFDEDGLPHTMEYVPASENETKLPDRFVSYGHSYTLVTWNSRIENIICPNHITELGVGGFAVGGQNKKLSNYDSLINVGNSAFSRSLGTWDYDYLPPNLKRIEAFGFERAPFTSNQTFQIPDTVEYIGSSAFQYYPGRAEPYWLSLPSSLKFIGDSVFYNNGGQLFPEEIIIPPLVETIGNNPFGGAGYLSTTITFQGTPTNIFANAFTTSTSVGTMKNLVTINVPWSEGEVANAPWGAVNATINYNYTGGQNENS